MNIDFAREADSKKLAILHYGARSRLPDSFMISLGPTFLNAYYRAILKTPNSFVICSRTNLGEIEGFISGTLDASVELQHLRQNKMHFLLCAIPVLLLRPGLLIGMYKRMVGKDSKGNFFIEDKGARIGFWCWREGVGAGGNAIVLFKKWLQIADCLGFSEVYGEVDADNKKLLTMHSVLGGKFIKKYQTPEGRDRMIVLYKSKHL